MDTATARLMANYRIWADTLTYQSVAALPAGEAEKERQTLFKSIIGTLNHNYVVDRIWQAHLLGEEHGYTARNVILHHELGALWSAQQAMSRWWKDWSEAQTGASLAEIVHFRFVDGQPGAMTRGAILLHVVNHATYHRGWVAEIFFQVPATSPTTDLPVYLQQIDDGGERVPR
ncbi:MAG TPA: DinB family protein [Chloroflexota bacterium]